MEDVRKVLHSARKVAEEAEVFSASIRATTIQFEANELKQVQTRESSSIALRIFKEGRIGFATASGIGGARERTSPSPNLSRRGGGACVDLIDMAVETSQFGGPANFQFPSRLHGEDTEVSVFDPKTEEIPLEKMVRAGRDLIARIKGHSPDILCDLQITKGASSISLVNSRGREGRYDKSFFSLSLEGILVRDTDMLWVEDSESSCRPDLVEIDNLAERVKWQLEQAKKKATVSNELLPVIFTPHGVVGALLSPLVLAFNGKTVLDGASPLKGKLGEQIFDRKLSLWDDATIAYGAGSYPFDDEGVPGQRLALVTNGLVGSFLYDLQTAASAGTHSTGNGRRAGGGFPSPAVSSLVIEKGDVSFQAMLEDMKEGLIVEEVIGAEQGNLLGGDFGGNVLLGYKVENGEIVGRVKDTMIAGNVYQVLKELRGVGQETRWVGGIVQTPHLYCSGVSVTTKGT
jgi:PmbA protein